MAGVQRDLRAAAPQPQRIDGARLFIFCYRMEVLFFAMAIAFQDRLEMMRSGRMVHRFKLPQLRALIVVAHTGSMAKAAKYLATSQSVVSKAVADLENVQRLLNCPPGRHLRRLSA